MTINDRVQTIIDALYSGNKSAFAKSINVNPTVIENVVGTRKGKPSYDVIFKICANANISEEWLISEKGEMLKTNRISRHNSVDEVPLVEYKSNDIPQVNQIPELQNIPTRPRIPLDAAAGSLSVALQSIAESDCVRMPVIPTLPSYDFTIVARGDSMTPEILSGDELACRFINENGFIQWGRTHVLDTAQGVVVKRIFDANDTILCRSSNPNYPDFPVPKDDIYHLALVVGLVRQV